jgi:hypothetical protein
MINKFIKNGFQIAWTYKNLFLVFSKSLVTEKLDFSKTKKVLMIKKFEMN